MRRQEIENKIRRSSQHMQPNNFRDFLEYARLVRDQDQVYNFMEENHIGIDEPQFWVAKLQHLKDKCQYIEFMKTLKKIENNAILKGHDNYPFIQNVQQELEDELKVYFRRKMKRRRTAEDYEKISFVHVQKQTRKFGNIQIYVDPENRCYFALEDYVDFIANDQNFKEQLQINRNIYLRKNQHKPLSFISQKNQNFLAIANQLILNRKSQRKSFRKSLRVSNSERNLQTPKTPDFNKKKKLRLSNNDSFQILKQIDFKTNRKSIQDNPEFQISDIHSDYHEKENIRGFFRNPLRDSLLKNEFSFARKSFSSLSPSRQSNQAFIYRRSPSEHTRRSESNLSEELGKVIQECQNSVFGTFTQTVSQIDSNRQNNYLNDERELYDVQREEDREKLRTIEKQRNDDDSVREMYEDLSELFGGNKILKRLSSQNLNSEKSKRFSRISQEKSYSFSQSKSFRKR